MENEELKHGEIYYHEVSNSKFIEKFDKFNHNNEAIFRESVSIKDKDRVYRIFDDEDFILEPTNLRKATQQEKDWLNACIAADKFIPLEEIINKNYEIY